MVIEIFEEEEKKIVFLLLQTKSKKLSFEILGINNNTFNQSLSTTKRHLIGVHSLLDNAPN